MSDAEIVGTCRVCGYHVVRVVKYVYWTIGPGGRGESTKEVKIACGECGVMYAKPPPARKEGSI